MEQTHSLKEERPTCITPIAQKPDHECHGGSMKGTVLYSTEEQTGDRAATRWGCLSRERGQPG